jgi:hypothetical protein
MNTVFLSICLKISKVKDADRILIEITIFGGTVLFKSENACVDKYLIMMGL